MTVKILGSANPDSSSFHPGFVVRGRLALGGCDVGTLWSGCGILGSRPPCGDGCGGFLLAHELNPFLRGVRA